METKGSGMRIEDGFFEYFRAVKQAKIPATHKLILLDLADRARESSGKFIAWPGLTRLAKDCGTYRGSVQRILKQLTEWGWIESTGTSESGTTVRALRLDAPSVQTRQAYTPVRAKRTQVYAPSGPKDLIKDPVKDLFGASPENSPEPTPKPQPQQKKRAAPKQRSVFAPPSVEDVKALMIERGWDDDKAESEAESFHAHYDARDWTFKGGVKMKRWQAAVTTWMTNRRNWDWEKKQKDDPFAVIRRTFTIEEMRAMEAADG